ncbi:Methyl jasmonate esterase 1 [Linum perenne]
MDDKSNYEKISLVPLKSKLEKQMEGKQMHFVLVHGACHGAWCWYKVVPLLEQAGHKVTAIDLGASGINPKQATELRAISDYHEPLMELMASLSGEEEKKKVILVGHSMGGVAISAAMERFPEKVAVGIFASAVMPAPHPGLGYSGSREEIFKRIDFLDSQFSFDNGPENPPTSLLFGPTVMSTNLYQLCPAEDLTLGTLLIRPCPLFKDSEVDTEIGLTREKYGSIPRIYIVCEADAIIKGDMQRWMIESNPTEDVKSISGADHMLMLSKPLEFCFCLLESATKYS